jgi:hypothetical protein
MKKGLELERNRVERLDDPLVFVDRERRQQQIRVLSSLGGRLVIDHRGGALKRGNLYHVAPVRRNGNGRGAEIDQTRVAVC